MEYPRGLRRESWTAARCDQAPFGGMAVTQEPSRSMAALQSVLPIGRTSRLDAEAGDAMEASPVQEAGSCLLYLAVYTPTSSRKREVQTAAYSSRGCPQDEQVCWDGRRVRLVAFQRSGRDAGAVTNHGGAAIGVVDATHESAGCRGGRRYGSVAGAGSRVLPVVPCGVHPHEFAQAGGSDGCRKQPGLPAGRARWVGWSRGATACLSAGWP